MLNLYFDNDAVKRKPEILRFVYLGRELRTTNINILLNNFIDCDRENKLDALTRFGILYTVLSIKSRLGFVHFLTCSLVEWKY